MELYFGKYASYKRCDCAIIMPACTTADIQSFRTRISDAEAVKSCFDKTPNKVTYLLETWVLGLFTLDELINVAIFTLAYTQARVFESFSALEC